MLRSLVRRDSCGASAEPLGVQTGKGHSSLTCSTVIHCTDCPFISSGIDNLKKKRRCAQSPNDDVGFSHRFNGSVVVKFLSVIS